MDQRSGPTTFGSISGKNVIAGTNVTGSLNLTINNNSDGEQHAAPCYSIPFPRNEDVIHRTAISDRLAALLPPSREYHSAALWGLGGSGKTQIALDYAYRRCRDDPACSVFWVHADSEASFAQDYKAIARKLGLSESLSGKDLLIAVRAGIEANQCWLLVIDNADNLQLFGVQNVPRTGDQEQTENTTLNLSEFVPRGPVGSVLWTSRDKGVGSLVGARRTIEVARMADDEAMKLLKTVGDIGEGELDGAAALLAELDCFALALSQAAAFMRKMSITITEYLSRLASRDKRWAVLQNSVHDPHRRQSLTNSILKTWDISMEQIRQENRTAFDILHMLAFLDNQSIPFKILHHAVTLRNGRFTDDDIFDEEEALQAAGRLQEFAFLHRRGSEDISRVYKMHKLVQDATLYTLTNKDRGENKVRCLRLAIRVVADLFPVPEQEHWRECERYVVHARRVAEWAGLWKEETQASRLFTRVSLYLFHRGMWNERELVDKMAYEFHVKRFGRNHHATIKSWGSLATTYIGQGRYKEAEEITIEVSALLRLVLGERHVDTINNMENLAAIYYEQGRYAEAEKMESEVISLRHGILGDRHSDTIRGMSNLGVVYCKRGMYDEAEEIVLRALALRRDTFGGTRRDIIQSLANLGIVYREQGRYNEAKEIVLSVLALQRDTFGERHPDTSLYMVSLAGIYLKQGRYEEAEEIQVESLALLRHVLGGRHPATIRIMAHLVVTYQEQGRYEEAGDLGVEVLTLHRDIIGEKHPDTIRVMWELAVTLYRLQRTHEAVAMMKDCSALFHEIWGADHHDTRHCLERLNDWERRRVE